MPISKCQSLAIKHAQISKRLQAYTVSFMQEKHRALDQFSTIYTVYVSPAGWKMPLYHIIKTCLNLIVIYSVKVIAQHFRTNVFALLLGGK